MANANLFKIWFEYCMTSIFAQFCSFFWKMLISLDCSSYNHPTPDFSQSWTFRYVICILCFSIDISRLNISRTQMNLAPPFLNRLGSSFTELLSWGMSLCFVFFWRVVHSVQHSWYAMALLHGTRLFRTDIPGVVRTSLSPRFTSWRCLKP